MAWASWRASNASSRRCRAGRQLSPPSAMRSSTRRGSRTRLTEDRVSTLGPLLHWILKLARFAVRVRRPRAEALVAQPAKSSRSFRQRPASFQSLDYYCYTALAVAASS